MYACAWRTCYQSTTYIHRDLEIRFQLFAPIKTYYFDVYNCRTYSTRDHNHTRMYHLLCNGYSALTPVRAIIHFCLLTTCETHARTIEKGELRASWLGLGRRHRICEELTQLLFYRFRLIASIMCWSSAVFSFRFTICEETNLQHAMRGLRCLTADCHMFVTI